MSVVSTKTRDIREQFGSSALFPAIWSALARNDGTSRSALVICEKWREPARLGTKADTGATTAFHQMSPGPGLNELRDGPRDRGGAIHAHMRRAPLSNTEPGPHNVGAADIWRNEKAAGVMAVIGPGTSPQIGAIRPLISPEFPRIAAIRPLVAELVRETEIVSHEQPICTKTSVQGDVTKEPG